MVSAGLQSGLRGVPYARPPLPGRFDVAEGTSVPIKKTDSEVLG
jgi:hypothetical protein